MITEPHIHYLKRQDIDISRWEACIADSSNRLIYGSGFYLDAITGGQWDALVWEDYKAVMPLTWRRKWGIHYLCQPAFTQQTGIFSPSPVAPETTRAFLAAVARHYRFAEVYLNYGNPHPSLRTHENLILPLQDPYPVLQSRYKKDLQRNLRLANAAGLTYTPELGLDAAIEAYRSQYAGRHPAIRPEDYTRFHKLCQSLQPAETNAPEKPGPAETNASEKPGPDIQPSPASLPAPEKPNTQPGPAAQPISDQPNAQPGPAPQSAPEKPNTQPSPNALSGPATLILRAAVKAGQLCATALLIRDASRLYLLQSTTPPAGRKLQANHFLIDQLVREFAGTGHILDFEGSDLPGIAYFYANFGAIRQPYFFHRHNRLPWPWRLLKP